MTDIHNVQMQAVLKVVRQDHNQQPTKQNPVDIQRLANIITERMFKNLDIDSDGNVTRTEFDIRMVEFKVHKGWPLKKIEEATTGFVLSDANRDKNLTKKELHDFQLKYLGQVSELKRQEYAKAYGVK
jgi:Ca2+-binding EF-hand superfamily protein